jgi:hypothetical protein
MAVNLNNFIIDRVIRGVAQSQTDDSVLFAINQITNPSLTCASESTDAVDALGTPVATFYRSKSAEFSAENAIFDMNLLAVQVGADKKVADANNKITTPAFDKIEIKAGETAYTLKNSPKTAPGFCYALNDDGTVGQKYVKGDAAGAGKFVINDKAFTPPTDVVAGTTLLVIYEYESEAGISVVNSAKKFPTGCKFTLEVLGCDVCDQTNLLFAYIIFPNFKLSPDFDWNIATDGSHPFSGKAMQKYCEKENRLFEIIIVDGEDDAI